MREPMATELRTTRLTLSAFVMDDAEELHAIFSDPQTHTIGSGPYTSFEQTRDWVARRGQRYAQHGLAWYALRDRKTSELIGNAGLFMGRTGTEPEIGYEVKVAWQGQGLATEAATAVVREAEQKTWPRLWATVRPANAASRSVLARLGFVEDSVRDREEGPLIYLCREGRSDVEGAR